MTMLSIGDLAQSLQLRRDNARLNERLSVLTRELSTGQTANPDARLRGDYTIKAALTTDLTRNASLQRAFDEFTLETDARQAALGTVLDLSREVNSTLIQVSGTLGPGSRLAAAQTAAARFDAVLQTLNTQIGGRSLFAGQAVGGPALAPSEVILDAISAAITAANAVTPEEIEQTIRTWFGPGGDFETIGYAGSPDSVTGPSRAGDFETRAPTALDQRIAGTLAGLATAALVDRGVVDPASDGAGDLLARASVMLLTADQDLVSLRAEIGTVQSENETAIAEMSSRRFALEQSLASLTEVDAFETAVALETTETQLRALYALTSKLSGLSLTEFLR